MNQAVRLWRHNKLNKKSRLKSCLILLCLVFAPIVSALMFSESMMNGITNKYICLSDGHLQTRESPESLQSEYIYSCDEVINGYALLYSSNANTACTLKGVKEDYFNQKRSDQITFVEKKLDESNLKGLIISRYTANILGVDVGDKVALMIVPDNPNAVLRPVMVRVERIYYSGYDQLDKLLGFIDFDYAKTLFKDDSSYVNEILVNDKYSENLESVIAKLNLSEVSQWSEHNLSVYRNFVSSRQAIFVVLITIIVAASFFTASVAQQMIQDDIRDIAVNKLIGMDDRKVKQWAFSTVFGVTLTSIAMGTLLGTAIGFAISPVMKFVSKLGFPGFSNYLLDFEVTFPLIEVLKVIVLMIVISALSIRICLFRTRRIKAMVLFND